MKYFILFFITILFNFSIAQEPLKRKGTIGIRFSEMNDSLRKICKFNGDGFLIEKVVENSTAANAGIKNNDILIEVNGKIFKTQNELLKNLSQLREGDRFEGKYFRNGKEIGFKTTVLAKPYEKSEEFDVIYDKISFRSGWLRTITCKPKTTEKMPAILFIPGYMCYSLDNIGNHPYSHLVHGLTKQGFVVVRVEKSGEGDNLNTPDCREIGLKTEVEAFSRGIDFIKTLNYVDTANIFIWGHSLGGIEAPMIAAEKKIKGIVVYGTAIKTWAEYMIEMFRVQNPLMGVDYLENEALIKQVYPFVYEFLIMKKTPSELVKNKEYAEIMKNMMDYDGNRQLWSRDYTYWQEIQDVNQTQCLKDAGCYVLSCWGEYDIEAFSEWEHKEIANIVNNYHPGKGTYLKFLSTTHAFTKVASMKEGIENKTIDFIMSNFNEDVVLKTAEWIKNISGKK